MNKLLFLLFCSAITPLLHTMEESGNSSYPSRAEQQSNSQDETKLVCHAISQIIDLPLDDEKFKPHWQTIEDKFEILSLLIKNGQINLRAKNDKGATLLHKAIAGGNNRVIKLLIENKIDLNARWGSFTPLHLAAIQGNLEAAQLLIQNKADLNAETEESFTALSLAIRYKHSDVVNLLLDNISFDTSPMHDAAFAGNTQLLHLFLSKGFSVDTKDNAGRTPLHRALLNGHSKAAKLLLNNGADIRLKDLCNYTPLDLAKNYLIYRETYRDAKYLTKCKQITDLISKYSEK